MNITNFRSEDLVEIITNSDLTEDDEHNLMEIAIHNKCKHIPSLETVKQANGEETNTAQMNNIY